MTEEHRSSALPGCAQQVLIDLGTGRLRPKWGSVCSWKRVKRCEYAANRRRKSALCVKSVRIEPYVELGAASRLFLLANTSLWKWSEGPSSQRRCVRWKKEGGGGSSAGSRTTNATISSVLTHWNDRRLGSTTENTSDRFTVSNSATLPPPLSQTTPTRWLNYDWHARRAMNERVRRFGGKSRFWLDETSGMRRDNKTNLVPSVCGQKKTRCHLHTKQRWRWSR